MRRSRGFFRKGAALAGLLASAALPAGARAAEATVSWTPDADRPIVGYRVYQATSSLLSLTTAQAALRGDVSRTDVALVPFVEAAGDLRAMVGALPAGMSLNYPAFPVITRTVDVNTSAQLSAAAAVAGSRIRVHAGVAGGLNVNASDVEIVVDAGVHVNSLSFGNGVRRVHVKGGDFGSVQFPIPYDFNTNVERQDWTVEDVILDGVAVENPGGMAVGMRGKRIALVHSRIQAGEYSIWGGDAKSVPFEDYVIADNTLASATTGANNQSTLRLVSVLRSVAVDNILSNTLTDGGTNPKHNYRIHGQSSLNFAARNRLLNSGTMIATLPGDAVGETWFEQNTFYHYAADLFNMDDNNIGLLHAHDNVAYTDVWGSFPNPHGANGNWDLGNNRVRPFQPAPAAAGFLSGLAFRTAPLPGAGTAAYFRVTAVDVGGNESFFNATAGGLAAEGSAAPAAPGDAFQLSLPARFSWSSPPVVDVTPPASPRALKVR